jgi:pimeloyl-ACP methyl ester carboxylesterase
LLEEDMKTRIVALLTLVVTSCVAAAPEARAATLNGARIHSTSTGQGDRTLIFVHGWTCDETSWSEQVPVLARKYRVITIDLPGHGQSDPPKDGRFSMDVFAEAVEAVRAEARADRVVLVGHSMGGPVVYRYAQLHPEHLAALVLDGKRRAERDGRPGGLGESRREGAGAGHFRGDVRRQRPRRDEVVSARSAVPERAGHWALPHDGEACRVQSDGHGISGTAAVLAVCASIGF